MQQKNRISKPYWYQYITHTDPEVIHNVIKEKYLPTSSGKIHIDIYPPLKDGLCKGNILFIHGTAIYSRFYAEFAFGLAQKGYRVILPDLPGHGLSEGKRGHFTMELLVSALKSVVTEIKSQYQEPLIAMGSSLGGISSLYLALADSRIDGLICHNAALFHKEAYKEIVQVKGFLKLFVPLVPILSKVLPRFKLSVFRYLPRESLVSSPEGNRLFDTFFKDPLLAKKYTLTSLYTQMTEAPRNPLDTLNVPILFLNGEHDRLFPVPFITQIYDQVPHEKKELYIIPKMDHLILQEKTEESLTACLSFLTKYFPTKEE